MAMKSFALTTATTLMLSCLAVAQVNADNTKDHDRAANTDRDGMKSEQSMRDSRAMSGDSHKHESALFERLDTNSDTYVDEKEARQGGLMNFRDYDSDGDGKISEKEFDDQKDKQ